LKTKQAQGSQALADARASLSSPSQLEPSPLSGHPLQGKEPYRYDDPFASAVSPEDWDILQWLF
jgi:hypothetical protein